MEPISVIIPTRNGAAYLPRLLGALWAQSRPPTEIVVVDSDSGDRTPELARRFGCTVVSTSAAEFRHGATRNQAVLHATGNLLVFMTQDALPADTAYLAELVFPIANRGAAATYARQLPRPDAGALERFDRAFHYPAESAAAHNEIRRYYFSDAASAVSRAAFFQVGGFPPDTPSAEDRLLSKKLQRVGHRVQYTPSAQVIHSHALSPLGQLRRYFDFGATAALASEQSGTGGLTGEGLRYCTALWHDLGYSALPQAALELAAKALGYWLGMHFHRLPPSLRAQLGTSAWWRRPLPQWSQDDPQILRGRASGASAGAHQP